jgi:hypothetical protein
MAKPALTVVDPTAAELRPPRPLGPAGTQLWNDVLNEFTLDDCAALQLLCLAAESLDRAQRLSAAIAKDGEMIRTKSGIRINPAIKDETACRALAARLLQQLGLLSEAIKPVGRPPKAY